MVVSSPGPLSVTPAQLDNQMRWLRDEGFVFLTVADLLTALKPDGVWPERGVLVTFDDAYDDTFALARPVLLRLKVPAVVFVPTQFIGKTSAWDREAEPLMTAEQLRIMADEGFELALHSHQHRNFRGLSPGEIDSDITENIATFRAGDLPLTPALAYPYGGRPRQADMLREMKQLLAKQGVRLAFRIGNRINRRKPADAYELNRLGVRGDESEAAFRRKVRWGKLFF